MYDDDEGGGINLEDKEGEDDGVDPVEEWREEEWERIETDVRMGEGGALAGAGPREWGFKRISELISVDAGVASVIELSEEKRESESFGATIDSAGSRRIAGGEREECLEGEIAGEGGVELLMKAGIAW